MTDREIINRFRREVEAQGYTFEEKTNYDDTSEAKPNYLIDHRRGGDWLYLNLVNKPIPPCIKYLKNISCIDISNSICDLTWIGNFEQLTVLIIFYCDYKKLPNSFSNLKKLRTLYLCNAGISTLPNYIKDMTSLENIIIHGDQHVFYLPKWLSQLPNLVDIHLENSTIHSIPADLLKTGLDFVTKNSNAKPGIHLFGTKLMEGDISLFSQPREIIEAFYSGKQNIFYECKVIFLGEGSSGKSSLIERMVNNTFVEGKLPTDGIRMQTWVRHIERDTIRLRLLDFGGQEIMHAMHRCFMTQHTVYVLVCESRVDGDIDREASRWLENVKEFACGCPVILALNKADINKHVSVNETGLKKVNPALWLPVLKTSAKWNQKEGTDSLANEILKAANSIISKTQGNEGILKLKQRLEIMPEDYITDIAYRKLCEECGVAGDVGNNLLSWFKELGVCYYYTASELDPRLEGLRVLNPEWLTTGIYRLLLRTRTNGILSHEEIKRVLRATTPDDTMQDKVYTQEETEFILHVMRKFEISHNMGDGRELLPLKMDKNTPTSANAFDRKTALHLSWEAVYIPNTVVHKLMIRKYNELNQNCMWREGALFENGIGAQQALIEMTETRLDVYVQAKTDRRQYMEEFRKCLIMIFLDLNLEPKEMIHFEWEGIERKVLYSEVLELYHRDREEVYVAGAKKYPHPGWILQEHYVKEKERATMTIHDSTINITKGDHSPIATDEARQIIQQDVAQKGNIDMNQTRALDLDQLRAAILRRNTIEQDDFDELLKLMKTLSEQKISFGMKHRLTKIVRDNQDKTTASSWHKVRGFLSDGANLANMAMFGATCGKPILDFLQKLFAGS